MNKKMLNKPGKLIIDVFWPKGTKNSINLNDLQQRLEHNFMQKVAQQSDCCEQHKIIHLDPFSEVA